MLGYDWPRLHAALNDLPAALLIGAVVFDLLAAVTRRETLRTASFWTLMLGALGAVSAVVSGLQAEDHIAHGEAVHRVMETHEELALITAGIFGVLAIWRIFRERRMGPAERALVLAVGLGGAGVLTATGVYGGKLVFDHAAGVPTEVLKEEIEQRAAGHRHEAGEEHGDEADEHGEEPHEHSAAGADSVTSGDTTAPAGHVDPPGTPPHSHPAGTAPQGH